MAPFRAGNFDFILLAAHVRWGAGERARLPEVEVLASWVVKRVKARCADDQDIIVLGDFNIPDTDKVLFRRLRRRASACPSACSDRTGPTSPATRATTRSCTSPRFTSAFTGQRGVLDFNGGDHAPLVPAHKLTKNELTYERSGHLALWAQVNTDHDAEQLDQILNGPARR